MSTQTDVKTSEVLDLAADLIEERGWAKIAWNNDKTDAPMCVEGAIAAAIGITAPLGVTDSDAEYDQLTACPAYRAVSAHVGRGTLFHWNDEVSRTKEEVIKTLRTVAEAERKAGR